MPSLPPDFSEMGFQRQLLWLAQTGHKALQALGERARAESDSQKKNEQPPPKRPSSRAIGRSPRRRS
jgi:hypothetical protein